MSESITESILEINGLNGMINLNPFVFSTKHEFEIDGNDDDPMVG